MIRPKKLSRKKAFWSVLKFRIISRKPAANAAKLFITIWKYHKANSQQNTQRCVEFVLGKFYDQFQEKVLASVSQEDVLSFLTKLTFNRRQTTKRNRYSVLHSFYNFTINTSLPDLKNPWCNSVIKKIFRRPYPIQARIIDKDTIDEIIFRTTTARDRIMLELMARAGMRICMDIKRWRCLGIAEISNGISFNGRKVVKCNTAKVFPGQSS